MVSGGNATHGPAVVGLPLDQTVKEANGDAVLPTRVKVLQNLARQELDVLEEHGGNGETRQRRRGRRGGAEKNRIEEEQRRRAKKKRSGEDEELEGRRAEKKKKSREENVCSSFLPKVAGTCVCSTPLLQIFRL